MSAMPVLPRTTPVQLFGAGEVAVPSALVSPPTESSRMEVRVIGAEEVPWAKRVPLTLRLSPPTKFLRMVLGWRVSVVRSEEHTSELQSHVKIVCRLLREKKVPSEPLRTRALLVL